MSLWSTNMSTSFWGEKVPPQWQLLYPFSWECVLCKEKRNEWEKMLTCVMSVDRWRWKISTDESKCEILGLSRRVFVGCWVGERTEEERVKHGGGSAMIRGFFAVSRLSEWVSGTLNKNTTKAFYSSMQYPLVYASQVRDSSYSKIMSQNIPSGGEETTMLEWHRSLWI